VPKHGPQAEVRNGNNGEHVRICSEDQIERQMERCGARQSGLCGFITRLWFQSGNLGGKFEWNVDWNTATLEGRGVVGVPWPGLTVNLQILMKPQKGK
jgi:hypothetical protein